MGNWLIELSGSWTRREKVGIVLAAIGVTTSCRYGWAVKQAKPLKASFRQVAATPDYYHRKRVPDAFFAQVAELLSPQHILAERHGRCFPLHLERTIPDGLTAGDWISFTGVFHNEDGGYFAVDRLVHHPHWRWKSYSARSDFSSERACFCTSTGGRGEG